MAKDLDYIDTAEAAKLLKVTPRRIQQMIHRQELPARSIGGIFLITRSDLDKIPKDRKPGPKPKAAKKSKGSL